MSPGKREAPGGNQGPDNALNTTPTVTPTPVRIREAWTCTWCAASLPPQELACDACKRDVVAQLRARYDADLRLRPLADLVRST